MKYEEMTLDQLTEENTRLSVQRDRLLCTMNPGFERDYESGAIMEVQLAINKVMTEKSIAAEAIVEQAYQVISAASIKSGEGFGKFGGRGG